MTSSSSFQVFLFFSLLIFPIIPLSTAKTTSFRPKALVLPITKDASTSQHLVQIKQRTPIVPVKLSVDLGGDFMWVDCENGYVSSSYNPARCGSAQCNLAKVFKECSNDTCYELPKPGCYNNTCRLHPANIFAGRFSVGDFGFDVVSLQSSDGFNPGKEVSAPNILFACGDAFLLKEGHPSGVTGVAGLGRQKISLPYQFASAFRFDKKFAVCFSSSTRSKGVIFFGNEPYVFLPNIDVSKSLIYTPLILNPVGGYEDYYPEGTSSEYYIEVKWNKINNKIVPINTTLLSIDKSGSGGTVISTANSYTRIQTSIYNAVVDAFVKALSKVRRVKAVSPFEVCYSSKSLGSTQVGPDVPPIDLVLHNKDVVWRIHGANSMVQVSDKVSCLGFVDGGVEPYTTIVTGRHLIEDNLLQFDLANSRLGFSNSLLSRRTTFSNFNFTSIA